MTGAVGGLAPRAAQCASILSGRPSALVCAPQENSVTLSTMKASKFFVVFEKEITYWEKTLSHISETVEIILQVQRSWMYLENIFIGSEDIRKQLPQESIMFENVHATFSRLMRTIAGISNCLKACTASGLLDTFQDMDAKLERIQKSLENYLENKRQQVRASSSMRDARALSRGQSLRQLVTISRKSSALNS